MGWKPVLAKTVAAYQETVHTAIRDVETGAVQVIRSDRKHPYFAQRLEDGGALFNVAYAAPPPSSHGHVYKGPVPGGAWVDAQNLRPGDRLINADGTWAEVISVTIQKQDLTAYNLSVRDYVTYFVAESTDDDAVWVHNIDCFKKPAGAKYVGNTASNQPMFETAGGKKIFLDNDLRYKDYVPGNDVARPIPTEFQSEVDPRLVKRPVGRSTAPPTSGVATHNGEDVFFHSGTDTGPAAKWVVNPKKAATESAAHVEGHAAAFMRENGLSELTVTINNTAGPCGNCLTQVREMLPKGHTLRVKYYDRVAEETLTKEVVGIGISARYLK